MVFEYKEAFARNLGLVTEDEQLVLKSKKIAIAGMGGVGGSHLQILTRLGIQRFHIADMDHFELVNFNRQSGSMMSTLGKSKVEVMRDSVLDINPDAEIKIFPQGVTESNIGEFLDGVDVYVDGLDFFVLDVRARIFEECRKRGIPAVTAGPVGWTTSYLVFDPYGMSFEEYFQLRKKSDLQKAVQFLVGLSPALAQRDQVVDERFVRLAEKRGPSLATACYACSAVMGTEVLKMLLGRGKTYYVPWAMQFDMYKNRYHKVYNWLGNRNFLNKIKIKFISKKIAGYLSHIVTEEKSYDSALMEILDSAKWAPSGDNGQPWKISVQSENEFSLDVSKFGSNVYNLFPMPDFIALGMFLENAAIAAVHKKMDLEWRMEGERINAALRKHKESKKNKNSLFPYIKIRSVNRYPYKLKKLPLTIKERLQSDLDRDIQIFWLENLKDRFKVAKTSMLCTDIRLRLPEAYEVHRDMIDWSGQSSPDKMPFKSLGANPLAGALMKWALQNRKRNQSLLKFPGATLSFQIELDLIPSLMCSGHFIMAFDPELTPHPQPQDYIRAGQSMQRFWLSLTAHNMALQPWYIPVMFSRYIDEGIKFTGDQSLYLKTKKLHDTLVDGILAPLNVNLRHVFFTGRVGYPLKTKIPRSVRKDLKEFIA